MALGVLSCAAKVCIIFHSCYLPLLSNHFVQIILAQAYRDAAVLELLKKLDQVYTFMAQDQMLGQISSMRMVLGQISQQTLECAQFIKNYSETKNFCES
jgi:hypothetical protein